MGINPQQERLHVATRNEMRDNSDGWDRGAFSPYPKDKEETILANIEKVSPAFVKGYREGKFYAAKADYV